jgi:kynureninase
VGAPCSPHQESEQGRHGGTDQPGATQHRADSAERSRGDQQWHAATQQILHEIGHLVSAHEGQCVLTESDAQRLAPHLAPAALAHLLERSHGDAEEHEAELIVMLIYQRAQDKSLIGRDVPDRAADRLARVADIFGA